MPNFTIPSSAEVELIQQELLPRLMEGRMCFDFADIEEKDSPNIAWDQEDSYTGLQQLRGIGGRPARVNATGSKRFTMEPGYFGEFEPVNEQEMMIRRVYGTIGTPTKIDDLIMPKITKLQQRYLDRVESTIWAAAMGNYQLLGPAGSYYLQQSIPVQTYTAANSWSQSQGTGTDNSTPLGDIESAQLFGSGRSVSFESDASIYMNLLTFNNFIRNRNSADLYGRRTEGLGTVNTLAAANALFLGMGLPQIKIYDLGYAADLPQGQIYDPALATTYFQKFIPNNTALLIGKRPGNAKVIRYQMVRNVNNPDMAPGQYTKIVMKDQEIPYSVEVHNGHNGGPAVYYPSACVLMHV